MICLCKNCLICAKIFTTILINDDTHTHPIRMHAVQSAVAQEYRNTVSSTKQISPENSQLLSVRHSQKYIDKWLTHLYHIAEFLK